MSVSYIYRVTEHYRDIIESKRLERLFTLLSVGLKKLLVILMIRLRQKH
jgi:hypothetical protein